MTLDFTSQADEATEEYTAVTGGLLIQDSDRSTELDSPEQWETMTERTPSTEEIQAMRFAMKVCKHVKCNAIVVSNGHQTLGIGGGQMNRVGAAKIALEQAKLALTGKADQLLVMASDAFFPMEDTVILAADYGVTAVIQPGGSLKDQLSVDACNERGVAMVKTGIRLFKH